MIRNIVEGTESTIEFRVSAELVNKLIKHPFELFNTYLKETPCLAYDMTVRLDIYNGSDQYGLPTITFSGAETIIIKCKLSFRQYIIEAIRSIYGIEIQ